MSPRLARITIDPAPPTRPHVARDASSAPRLSTKMQTQEGNRRTSEKK